MSKLKNRLRGLTPEQEAAADLAIRQLSALKELEALCHRHRVLIGFERGVGVDGREFVRVVFHDQGSGNLPEVAPVKVPA